MSKEISDAIAHLILNSGQFYAYILSQMERVPDEKMPMPTIGVTVNKGKIELHYTPSFVSDFKTEDLAKILEHECLHLILEHTMEKRGLGHEPQISNIAADICVHDNMQIPDVLYRISGEEFQVVKWGKYQKYHVVENDTYESNYIKLMKGAKKIVIVDDNGNVVKGCGMGVTVGDKLSEDLIKKIVKEAISKSYGNVPYSVARAYSEVPPKLPWKQIMKQFIIGSSKSKSRATWKRPSRRFEFEQKGRLKDRIPDIVFVMDTSGSIKETQLNAFVAELRAIHKELATDIFLI